MENILFPVRKDKVKRLQVGTNSVFKNSEVYGWGK